MAQVTDNSKEQSNTETGIAEGKHLFDTGEGYWMTYNDWEILANERESFKATINERDIQIVELKGKLLSANEKIDIQNETIELERKQTNIIIASKNKVIVELEDKLNISAEKIALLEENSEMKDIQIANWQELYRNKDPDLSENLKWGGGGLAAGVVLGILAGVSASN